MEFSKKLLILDYVILILLLICTLIFPGVDFIAIDIAWVAQVGISSAAYYWKAKTENRTKVPLMVIKSLPKSMREKIDLTEIITSIIGKE